MERVGEKTVNFKVQNLAPRSLRKYTILTLEYQNSYFIVDFYMQISATLWALQLEKDFRFMLHCTCLTGFMFIDRNFVG